MSDKKPRTKRAATRSSGTPGKREKVDWQGYINVNLTPQEKKEFDNWAQTADLWAVSIPNALSSGYTLSINEDTYNNAYAAGLYCIDPDSESAGWKLSIRGKLPDVALYRLFFVHEVVLDRDWRSVQGRNVDTW